MQNRTINSYRGILTGLLLHYPKIEPANIALEQINAYVIYKKKSAGISDSAHNQIIWLFEGQTGGQYSESSLQALFGRAREESDVNPFITIHGLRHSFATHLVERGVSLHKVKQLLGHEHLKTTEVCLHLAQDFFQKVQSPWKGWICKEFCIFEK